MFFRLKYSLVIIWICGFLYFFVFIIPACEFSQAQDFKLYLLDSLIDQSKNNIYELWYYEDYLKAQAAYDTLAVFAQRRKRWGKIIEILNDQTFLALYYDDFLKASHLNKKGFEILENNVKALHTDIWEFNLLYAKSYIEFEAGDYESSLFTGKKSLKLIQSNDSLNQNIALLLIALASRDLARYDESIQYFQSSIKYLPKKSSSYTEVYNYDYEYARLLNDLGNVYQKKLEIQLDTVYYSNAKKYIQKSINILEYHRANLAAKQISIGALANLSFRQHKNLANLSIKINNYDIALDYLTKSKAYMQDEQASIEYAMLQGDVYYFTQKYPQAIQAYDSAYQIAQEFYPGVHPNKALALQKIGEVYAAQKTYEKAIQHYQKAITQLDSTFQYDNDLVVNPSLKNVFWNKDLLQILVLKAQAYQLWATQKQPDLQKLQTAQKTYHLATELVDQIRQNFNLKEHSELLAERFYGLYEQALSNALAIKSLQKNQEAIHAEIFYLFEKSRSAVLLESHQKWASQSNQLLPDSLIEREKLYLGEIYLLKNKIYDTKDEKEKSELLSRLLKTESNYEQFTQVLQRNYPTYYAFKHQTKVLTLQDAQQKLSANPTQIVSYLFGEKHIYGMGIDSKQLIIRQIPRTDKLENDLSQLISYIKDEKKIGSQDAFVQYNQLAYTNYQNLLAPLLTQPKGTAQKLVIIPDGLLCYLPFEVLHTAPNPQSKAVNFVDLPYLLHRFALRYEYSITLLLDKSQHSTSSKASNQYLGFAPQYENNDFLGSKRSFSEEFPHSKRSTGELKHNREEIAYSSKLFAGQSFVGAEATKANFMRYVENCKGILHLSMHGLVNDSLPDQSCLVFGKVSTSLKRGTKTVSGESPLLYAYELYNMQIPAEMVILSACETGIGKLSRGEGILSLGRAFKLAGTQNLVMSYWAVDDQSTSKLIQLFLKNLKAGMDKDLALQKAKLSYLQVVGKSHQLAPHFWAAFVLVGDDLPLQSQQHFWSYLFYALFAAILGVGIFWVWRKFH